MKKAFSYNYTVNLDNVPQIAFSIIQVGVRGLERGEPTTTHSHNFFELFYVSKGEVILKIQDKETKLARKTIVAVAPGDVHSFRAVRPALLYFLNYTILFRRKLLFKTHRSIRGLTASVSGTTRTRKDLTPYFERLLQSRNKPEKRLHKTGIADLLKLVNRILKKRGRLRSVDDWGLKRDNAVHVVRGIAYIKKNILNNISIRDVCRKCVHASPRHFGRIFKKTTGHTPREFLNWLKIEKAKIMLGKGQPAKVVAQKLGFKEIYSFYRAFHRVAGISITGYLHNLDLLGRRP